MIAPTRFIVPGELLLPGQAIIVTLEGDQATVTRVATALRDSAVLVQQNVATRAGRLSVLYRPILALQAPVLVRMITDAAGGSPVRFALRTTDIPGLLEAAAQETVEYMADAALIVPRAIRRALVPDAGSAIAIAVGGGLLLLLAGVYLARK